MGGSAKIVIEGAPAGILTRWPDDREGIEALARYARLRGIGDPREDAAGLAQVVQILGNCVETPSDVMLVPIDFDAEGDTETFVLSGWALTEHTGEDVPDENEVVRAMARIDAHQPERQRLGTAILPARTTKTALPNTGGLAAAVATPAWSVDEDEDVVPIAPRSEEPSYGPVDEDDDLERAWQETLAWASGIAVPDEETAESASASDTGGISDTGILRKLKQVTDDEYMMDGFGVNDTGILDAIQYEGDDDELVVMLSDDDEDPRLDGGDGGHASTASPASEEPLGKFADLDEPDMSDMFTDTGTLIVMRPVPAPESTGEIVVVPTDVEGTVMTSSDEQATQPLPEQGIPFSDVQPDETARNIVIPLEAPEIGPNLSTEETARNPLPYPEVMDAEFEPFVDEGKGKGKKSRPKHKRKAKTKDLDRDKGNAAEQVDQTDEASEAEKAESEEASASEA